MATIKIIKEAIDICRRTRISLFLWGHRGLGKSSIVRQFAVNNKIGFVDLRCSQIEASDIRGLPDAIAGKTQYLPPVDMPTGGMSYEEIETELSSLNASSSEYRLAYKRLQPFCNEGILFLDEVNRSQDDVLQSIFELIYDNSIGQYILPVGWNIIAAGNFMEGYITNGFSDPAFLDRFCHITLSSGEATLDEWISYMSQVYGDAASNVIEFASHNVNHLDGCLEGELGFNIQPSRRSWELVTKVESLMRSTQYSQEAILEVYAGLIGRDLALSYMKYNCPIKPKNLLEDGVHKHIKALDKLQRNQICGLMWGMVASCKHRIDQDDISTACIDFAKYMINHNRERDLAVAFCRALVNDIDQSDQIKSAAISNPNLAKLMSKFNNKASKTKDFIDRLSEVPELHKTIADVCWGTGD